MSFTIREMPKAKQDKSSIYSWLNARSPAGAVAWLEAYDEAIERLKRDPLALAKAPESKEFDPHLRQVLFKTRRGRVYRAVYLVEGQEVFVLRVRGPGQAPILPIEIE